METLFLRLHLETGPPFYVVIRATQRSSLLKAKGVTSFLSYFKTLSIGPAPGIEPATSHSAVKRFTNGANTAAVKKGKSINRKGPQTKLSATIKGARFLWVSGQKPIWSFPWEVLSYMAYTEMCRWTWYAL